MDISQVSSAVVAQFAASAANHSAASIQAQNSTPAPQPAPANDSTHVDTKQLVQAVNQINQIVQSVNPGVEFTIENGSNAVIVKVVDVQTQEVIRQFPSEAAIGIAQALDNLQGLLLQHKT